jgi:hypothetical protein
MVLSVDSLPLLLALAGTLATASGCSLRYDTDDLGGGGETDDGSDDGIYGGPDAAPGALHVQAVFPFLALEGEGASLDPEQMQMVRPIPIVVAGANFTPDTTFTVEGEGVDRQEVAAIVSGDGKWAAFEWRIPVDEEVGRGSDLPLTIVVEKGDEEKTGSFVRQMLNEIDQTDGTIDTGDLQDGVIHSHVRLRGAVTGVGSRPLRLIGIAGVSVQGVLSADAPNQNGGPGGCPGGSLGQQSNCGAGSGGAGGGGLLAGGGGGGGGFGADDATPGSGGKTAGTKGGISGRESLVLLPPDGDNRGAGGGGGGPILNVTAPPADADVNAGGGSGGVIELSSPAFVELEGSIVTANGANGGDCGLGLSGAGGGGSGGAILVRAGTALLAGQGMTLQARGGVGGGNGECAGGNGGIGRIRVDQPNESGIGTVPEAYRGPAFLPGLPVISREQELAVMIRGSDQKSYRLRIITIDPASGNERLALEQVTTSDGVAAATVTLFEGHNRLCAEADPEVDLSDPDDYRESQNCLNIAYIPQ